MFCIAFSSECVLWIKFCFPSLAQTRCRITLWLSICWFKQQPELNMLQYGTWPNKIKMRWGTRRKTTHDDKTERRRNRCEKFTSPDERQYCRRWVFIWKNYIWMRSIFKLKKKEAKWMNCKCKETYTILDVTKLYLLSELGERGGGGASEWVRATQQERTNRRNRLSERERHR